MSINSEVTLWLLLGLGIPTMLAVVLLVIPHRIIQLQGRFYRKVYRDMLKLTDNQIDDFRRLPTDEATMGKRSDFIRQAPEDPRKYKRLIFMYRIVGGVLVAFIVLAFSLLALAFWSGVFP